MSPAAKQEMLASPSTEEIFSLAAGVAAALETRDGANTARDEKSHQGIFFKNRRPRVSSTWVKWSGTHQDRSLAWSETVLGPTIYLYDGPETIEEIDNGGNVLARYTQGSDVDEPLSEVRSGTVSFYEQDGLGSVSSLTNSASTIAGTYSYDSFGNLTASTGTLVDPFQYTGREFDPETGRYYYRARYFDPTAGRFLGEDPLGFPGSGSNFYTYAGNDPASLSDPFGLCPTKKPKCKKCQTKVLAAVNSKIGVPVTLVGATAFPQGMPGTDAGDPGMRNGACNFDFFVPGYTPPPMLGNCGRYSPNFTGIGSSLHIVYPGGGACNPLNDPTTYAVDETGFYFTAHMDSGYVFSPLGGLTHGIVDVLLKVKHGC